MFDTVRNFRENLKLLPQSEIVTKMRNCSLKSKIFTEIRNFHRKPIFLQRSKICLSRVVRARVGKAKKPISHTLIVRGADNTFRVEYFSHKRRVNENVIKAI